MGKPMGQESYLRIEGVLTSGTWNYIAKPGHEASRIPAEFTMRRNQQERGDVAVVLLGANNALLASAYPLLGRPMCGGRKQGDRRVTLTAYLPLLPGASAYEVRN